MADFPTTIPTVTRPTHSDPANDSSATDMTVVVDEIADELEAIATKVGVTSSASTSTLDYKVKNLQEATFALAAASADADLPNSVAIGTAPAGELGGTWASPTVDATHSGSAHHSQSHALTGGDHTGLLPGGQGSIVTGVSIIASDTSILSYSQAGNSATAGQTWKFTYAGVHTNTSGSNRDHTVKLKIGGSTVLSMASFAFTTGVTNGAFYGEILFTYRTIGGSGTVIATGWQVGENDSPVAKPYGNTATTTIDTTATNALLLTDALSSVTSASATVNLATLTLINP